MIIGDNYFEVDTDKIELVGAIPELKDKYKEVVVKAIMNNLITLEEWNERFKNFRDSAGYSIIHYLEAKLSRKIDNFLTENPIMINNRDELQKRFGVKIINLKEFSEMQNELEN